MRKGSALLIVLGMMAFMVISAVAFSAYMRYSRLPNSYLRRTSSSRLLVKAALAEAIDQVDAAIGENIHPNVGRREPRPGVGGVSADLNGVQNESRANRNVWAQRVYLGTNSVSALLKPEDTVSTLTFEGLAYIPPPLVNYARYYSRRSTAATWKTLGFDSGRYAFCAIDVSDFFDVNALAANAGRSSAANGRVTLAHLFENRAHTSYAADPAAWDGSSFMQNFRDESPLAGAIKGKQAMNTSSKVPLVSVADLNLAINEKNPGSFISPFCEYVENGLSAFYNGLDAQSEDGARIAGMTFVTDAYYPSTGGTGADDDYDLADPRNQPWPAGTRLDGPAGGVTLGTVMNTLTDAGRRIRNHIGGLGMAELYDWIDENNVPVSLSIPQVERTPMIAGIEPTLNGASVKVSETTEPSVDQLSDDYPAEYGGKKAGPSSTTRTIRYRNIYKLDPQMFSAAFMGTVKTVLAYPFRRGPDVSDPDSFKLDGHLSVYLTTGGFRFRTENDATLLQMTAEGGGLGTKTQMPNGTGVFHAQYPMNAIPLPSPDNTDEQRAAIEVTLSGDTSAAQAVYNAVQDNPLLTVTWEQDQTATQDEMTKKWTWANNGDPRIAEAVCGMMPVTAAGIPDKDFNAATVKSWIKEGTRTVSVRAAVWLRVQNGDARTVDLVPACLNDDKTFLGADNSNSMGPAGSDDLGSAFPLMCFDGGSFEFSLASFKQFTPVGLNFAANGNKGVICPDPRWNWAPEHWYAVNAVNANEWLNAAHTLQGGSGCDHDVFLSSSDAGYLQSIYELAFLPRVTNWDDKLSNHNYGDYSMGTVRSPMNGNLTAWPTAAGVNADKMWRTYCPYDRQGCARDDFEGIGFVNQGGGCKVNPYSDNLNVVMAALANTPFDWWAASTNVDAEVSVSESDRLNAKTFNQKYAFNEMNSKAKLKWADLEKIAKSYIASVHGKDTTVNDTGKPGVDTTNTAEGEGIRNTTESDVNLWEDQWNSLDWDGQNSDFCGVTSSDLNVLSDCDRKFLYGYWRECFAPLQQLFLIFVRAEPLMMGGSDSMPPQLGARAVALVWRDPYGTGDNTKPHRTRVLFYRQFE